MISNHRTIEVKVGIIVYTPKNLHFYSYFTYIMRIYYVFFVFEKNFRKLKCLLTNKCLYLYKKKSDKNNFSHIKYQSSYE